MAAQPCEYTKTTESFTLNGGTVQPVNYISIKMSNHAQNW